ncbi:MAG TPA: HEPN domain-containing protein [Bacteroidales bacterium]|nr:HEPN domain-containing protein [Bacteroidales bacterium]
MVVIKDFNNIEINVEIEDYSFPIFCCIENLLIDTKNQFNIELANEIWLTNDIKNINNLDLNKIKKEIGILSYEYLLSSSNIYAYKVISNKKLIIVNDELQQFIDFINLFCSFCLWFVKDNNTYINEVYFAWAAVSSKYSNSYSYKVDNSSVTTFTYEDIENAVSIMQTIFNIEKIKYILPSTPPLHQDDKNNIIYKSIYLISIIRSSFDLSMKISNSCMLFELFFSADSSEIVHKLSERIAFFLTNNAEQRIKIYKCVKDAYNIRSKLMHGDCLQSSLFNRIQEVANNCDSLIRVLMYSILSYKKVHAIFLMDNVQKNEYFERLVFGVENSPLWDKADDFELIING